MSTYSNYHHSTANWQNIAGFKNFFTWNLVRLGHPMLEIFELRHGHNPDQLCKPWRMKITKGFLFPFTFFKNCKIFVFVVLAAKAGRGGRASLLRLMNFSLSLWLTLVSAKFFGLKFFANWVSCHPAVVRLSSKVRIEVKEKVSE